MFAPLSKFGFEKRFSERQLNLDLFLAELDVEV
jgi:hypothetical protein